MSGEIELQGQGQEPSPQEPEVTNQQPQGSKKRVITRPPCQIAQAQAPIQACLRPGMWCPGARNLHSAKETWRVKAGIENTIDQLVAGVPTIDTIDHLKVHKVDKERNYVEIFVFTEGCNWLDVVEVRFRLGEEANTTIAETLSFSSGLFPAWIPLAFLCNVCCCYAPFSGNGMNTKRLEELRNALKLDVEVIAETKCNCCPS